MRNILILIASLIGFSPLSHAGVLFEPYAGYESGDFASTESTSLDETKYTKTSLNGGLRLGLRNMGFWIAAEGLYGSGGKLKNKLPGTSYTFTSLTGFGSIGYDFSSRIRIMAGVGFFDSLTFKNEDGTGNEVIYLGGTPVKAGLGFYLAPHICINVEYVMHDYKTYKTPLLQGPIAELEAESIRSSTVLVTLSLPMTF